MEYIAIVFRSRSDTVRLAEFLRKNGVRAEIINTPKEAGAGCGLSVKVSVSGLLPAKHAIRALGLSAPVGFFLVKMLYGRRTVRSI